MIKINKKLIAGFVITAISCQISFAKGDNHDLSRKCQHLASEIQELAKNNQDDLCSGDVLVAGAYVQSAGYALFHGKTQLASTSLFYAQNELKQISHNRSYCTLLAPKAKPFLAEAILLQGEIDVGQVPDGGMPDNTSD